MSKASSKARDTKTAITGLTIPPNRVARHCGHALNETNDERHAEAKERLEQLKKQGAKAPVHPERIKLAAKADEKAKHKKAMDSYQKNLKAYQAYSSDAYKKAETAFEVVCLLRKYHAILTQEGKEKKSDKPTQSEKTNMERIKSVLDDNMTAQRKTESASDYAKRKAAFVAPGYKALIKGVKLDDPASIQARADELAQDENVELFLTLSGLNGERPRSSSPVFVAIATCAERTINEIIEHSLESTTNETTSLQPDLIVADPIKLEQLHFWALVRDTPHMRALLGRERRRVAHQAAVDEETTKHNLRYKEARRKAKDAKLTLKKADWEKDNALKVVSFEEAEVAAGFAVKFQPEGKRKNSEEPKKARYYWKGLDSDAEPDEDSEDPNFVHYVRILCNKAREKLQITRPHVENVKISKKFTSFLSDLVVDLANAICHQLHIRLNPSGEHAKTLKTIKYDLVVDVVKQVLTFCYYPLNDAHESLISDMEEKAKLLKEHQTTARNPKLAAPAEEDEEDTSPAAAARPAASPAKVNGTAESDEEDSDTEVPSGTATAVAPKPAASPAAKAPGRQVVRSPAK